MVGELIDGRSEDLEDSRVVPLPFPQSQDCLGELFGAPGHGDALDKVFLALGID